MEERALLGRAGSLYRDGYFGHSLQDVWVASVHNLRRRVEAYGVELFLLVVKDEPGRKKFNPDGQTLNDRWEGVDDLVLIAGTTRLGLLGPQAGKALEMINWIRNHASPAHGRRGQKGRRDRDRADPAGQPVSDSLTRARHSVATLFDPVRNVDLRADQISLLGDQIRGLNPQDRRTCFGFMLDMLCKGNAPSTKNVQQLFPILWDVLPDELRKVAGVKSRYGWSAEEAAARTLMQFGAHVPSTCFEEVYQEILAVWCGNYWGRSTAHEILRPFIDRLNTDQIRRIARMFQRQHPPARRVVLQLAKGTRCELVDPSAGTVDDSSAQG